MFSQIYLSVNSSKFCGYSLEKQEELEAKANKMQAAIAQKDNKIIFLEDR